MKAEGWRDCNQNDGRGGGHPTIAISYFDAYKLAEVAGNAGADVAGTRADNERVDVADRYTALH
jgi:hypothetical protein